MYMATECQRLLHIDVEPAVPLHAHSTTRRWRQHYYGACLWRGNPHTYSKPTLSSKWNGP